MKTSHAESRTATTMRGMLCCPPVNMLRFVRHGFILSSCVQPPRVVVAHPEILRDHSLQHNGNAGVVYKQLVAEYVASDIYERL